MNYYIGVDPGQSGGVAVIHPNNHLSLFALDEQPDNCAELHYFLKSLPKEKTLAAIENLHALYGVRASSTFSLGWACGYWHGTLDSLGIQIEIVAPKDWKAKVTLPVQKPYISKGLPKAERRRMLTEHKKAIKNESIRAANEMFPGCRVTHDGIADAICIAAWRRYVYLSNMPESSGV